MGRREGVKAGRECQYRWRLAAGARCEGIKDGEVVGRVEVAGDA